MVKIASVTFSARNYCRNIPRHLSLSAKTSVCNTKYPSRRSLVSASFKLPSSTSQEQGTELQSVINELLLLDFSHNPKLGEITTLPDRRFRTREDEENYCSINPSGNILECQMRHYSTQTGTDTPSEENVAEKKLSNEWGGSDAEKAIVHIKENFLEVIGSYESLLVFFYTTWCSHCKALKKPFGIAALQMKKEQVPGSLAAINLTDKMEVADTFNIFAVPIIRYFRNGKFLAPYKGKRTVDDIVNFMKDPPKMSQITQKIEI